MATAVFACALGASALLLFAAWCDLATRTIPDGLSVGIAALGLLARSTEGPASVAASLLVAAVLYYAVFVPLHAFSALGGGDAKLLTASAIGLAPLATFDLLVSTVMAGGALSLLYLSLRLLPRPLPLPPQPHAWRASRILSLERRRFNRRGPLPYAVAIAVGGIFTLMKPFGA
ncbi:hypothetical protein GCM10009416_20390 [Craurococcus roseus]|uniref:Prepilin type IV endopeptidase peptidase domain-containing protein n=1 Tax=Craurococcus roseus TaxID=77585 RepID=A0ABP3Q2X9_9PROT